MTEKDVGDVNRKSAPVVAVVVLNYNGLEDTLKCLTSLSKLVSPAPIVVLVDNASQLDPRDAALNILPAALYVRTEANLGYAGGNNCGVTVALEAGADYILVLNNDTVVSPDIVTRLLQAMEQDGSLAVVGPVINYMEEPDRVMTDGVRFNPKNGREFFQRIVVPVGSSASPLVEVDIVNGCCMMLRASVVRTIGGFDESLFIVHEESDWCLRALRAGYKCAILPMTLVWHKGSSSFERSGRRWQRYYDTRNLFTLLARHASEVSDSRGRIRSLAACLRYSYHRHEHEREAGQGLAAGAVVEGVVDALTRRTGPYREGRRFLAPAVSGLFLLMRTLSRAKPLPRRHRIDE